MTAGTFPLAGVARNQIEIIIGDIKLKIERETALPPRNELTAVVPRAEIRRRFYKNGFILAEEEIILNSVTLVDAPGHPSEGGVHPRATAPLPQDGGGRG